MQSILYHNQSGAAAFTGALKSREVHRAITLHPIKQPSHMYRLHNYFKELKIQSLKQTMVQTHRQILRAQQAYLRSSDANNSGGRSTPVLESDSDNRQMDFIAEDVPLHNVMKGSPQYLGDTNLLGVQPGLKRHTPKNLNDVLVWNFIAKSLYSASESNPRRKFDSGLVEGINDVIMEIMETINMYSKQRGRIIDFKEILYAYTRLDPLNGVDWVLDLLLVYKKYRGHKMTVPVRRHAYVQQTFTGLEIREIPLPTKAKEPFVSDNYNENKYFIEDFRTHLRHRIHKTLQESLQQLRELNLLPFFITSTGHQSVFSNTNVFQNEYINLILPLSGRYRTFQRFLSFYEDVCIKNKEHTRLIIVIYKNQLDDFKRSLQLIDSLKKKYPKSNSIKVVEVLNKEFSRGEALQIGSDYCKSDDLLFLIDVDIVFQNDALMKVRLNTIKNRQVYLPIVFSEYNPFFTQFNNSICLKDSSSLLKSFDYLPDVNDNPVDFNNLLDKDGYWRMFGYGIAAIYKSDLELVGGFNTTIRGWGLEDVVLFDKLIKTNLQIFRVADPALRHVYHKIECNDDLNEAQKVMCVGSQASTLASGPTLYNFIINNKKIMEYRRYRRKKSRKTPGS